MISLFKHKKGNAVDIMLIGIFIIIIAVCIMIINYAFDTIGGEIETDMIDRNETEALAIIQQSTTDYSSFWDGAIVMLFLGAWVTALIGAFFLDSHPVFFIIAVFILIPIMTVMIYLNNFYIETMEIGEFVTYQTKYAATYFLGTHIFLISIFISATILIAIYTKSKL